MPRKKLDKLDTHAGLTIIEVAERLNYLRRVAERPAFEGTAMLARIIADYQRALDRLNEPDEELVAAKQEPAPAQSFNVWDVWNRKVSGDGEV